MWPCKDNSALSFTASPNSSLSEPFPSSLTLTHRAKNPQGSEQTYHPIHIHNRDKNAPLDSKSTPSSLLLHPKHACRRKHQWPTSSPLNLHSSGQWSGVVASVRVALVLEGSVCADQGPGLLWLRGLAKTLVCEMESERTQFQIALGMCSPSHLGKVQGRRPEWGSHGELIIELTEFVLLLA